MGNADSYDIGEIGSIDDFLQILCDIKFYYD